jgi:undecaprenyl-diphosphatase
MLQYLKDLDQSLFLLLNGYHHPAADPLMLFISHKFTWLPLYVLLLWMIIREKGVRPLIWILPGIALMITVSDIVSTQLFKEVFQRLRPCHNEEIRHLIHLVKNCGGMHGFVSSHASNSFAIAVFAGILLKKNQPKLLLWLILWASLISYSRIYLGVHYPGDIIGGALLGAFLGWMFFRIYRVISSSSIFSAGKTDTL